MLLFENILEVNANENLLNFGKFPAQASSMSHLELQFLLLFLPTESFKCFTSLRRLHLACNNIKSIRAKHEEFFNLEVSEPNQAFSFSHF